MNYKIIVVEDEDKRIKFFRPHLYPLTCFNNFLLFLTWVVPLFTLDIMI